MSHIGYADDPRINPLDVVERLAAGNDWSFERAGDDEITILVTGRWTEYQLSYTWMDELEALHLACAFDLKVPERRLAEVQTLISAINEQLWIGHFDLWTQQGLIMFRHALLLAGGEPSEPPVRSRCSRPRSIAASAISRPSSSWSGPAKAPRKRSPPPCSRPRARHESPLHVNRSSIPSIGMPRRRVRQLSPGLTGKARVNVPVLTISPAASGGLTGSSPEQFDQMAQRQKWAVEHVGGVPAVGQGAVALEVDLEDRQLAQPVRRARLERMTRTDQQRAVQGVAGHRVGGREFPVRERRLHDLETMRDPVDATGKRRFVHAGRRRAR